MFSKFVRLGRDAEVRYTHSQKPVAILSCAYDVGFGDRKKTQWIEATLWGDRAEKLAPHLLKGTAIVIYADDLELEQYQGRDGPSAKIKCRIVDLDFAGSPRQDQQPAQHAAPQRQQQSTPQTQPSRAAPQEHQYASQAAPAARESDETYQDIPF